jgi:hypothetical protein
VTAGLSEEVDAPDDISGDDRDADDRETREDA